MKEFVVLSKTGEVLERAFPRVNLTRDGEVDTVTIEHEGEDFLIGDTIDDNGKVTQIDTPTSERGKFKKKIADETALKDAIKSKLSLTDEELKLLTGESGASEIKIS